MRLATGQLVEREPVPLAVELELDAGVDEPFAAHALADARVGEEVGDALLEHAGADPRLDVLAAAVLDHDGVDPVEVEQLGEDQARRPGPDDRDLRLHSRSTVNDAVVAALTSSSVAPSRSSTSTSPPSRTLNTDSSVITTSTAPLAVSGYVQCGHDLRLAGGRRRRHRHDHAAGADDEVHRAADAEHVLARHRPVGDVAGRR